MASSSSSSPELHAAAQASSSHEHAYATVQYSDLSRDEVLEDLSSRFILNLPEEELASVERVCFQVEQAHWYYEDFIREQNPSKFPSYTLKTFSEALFRACPLLAHWAEDHDRSFEQFMKYKTRVPVCGAIMLNDTWDKVVLVKGWKSSAGWGFPKGKINEQEPKHRCAIREVLEETGYDLEEQLDPDNVLQMSIKEQSISLYIVPGVPEDYPFKTRTRKEISKISWFRLSELPTWKRGRTVPGKFYLISPFIGPLKAFIHDRKPHNLPRKIPKPSVQDVKEEIQSSSEEDGVAAQDQNAQELSSQASSAEPHTPSPQYSAARVHDSTFESSISTATPDPARQADPIPLNTGDSHLAVLLSGLMRSAASVTLDDAGKPQTPPVEVIPVPVPASHRQALPAQPCESPDWSAHAPAKISAPIVQPSSTVSAAIPPLQSPERTPLQSSSSGTSSATSLSLGTVGGGHARRGSTADISPYLSHSRNIAREMRYISILESVAQESDRATSRMGHRSPMAAPSQPAYLPLQPPSVPPPTIDQSVIYSSPAPHMPRSQGLHSAYRGQAPDVFMNRPQTSHAYHLPPFVPSTIPRQSMNEHQLRALLPLNGPYHGSASSFAPPPMYPALLQAPTSPLRTVPPPHYPAPHIAHNNAVRATNNAQLLSILNAPSPGYRA
ncbi:DCP2-domain-containing protein [Dichomitus squalens]|uniref:DCP2-domain-containing protein n=1 Tax=Dichomitus squalens TaxID=114155 RepID=A0A4Q9N3Z2_9APHY|nr:DCP2-domain-containing protein [Dichomitus squalens]